MVLLIGGSVALIALFGALIGFIMMRQGSAMQGDEEIVEAELLPEEDFSTLTVAELKKRLSEEGLSVSGNKAELIERLTTQTA